MDNIIRAAKKKRQKRNYFTKETENAIVQYNLSTDSEFKSNIYSAEIHYPFYKLTENIIHTFKFYYTDGVENLEDLQHEIMVFLLDKIHLFDLSKGAKAYSYFGTIVKRWLILYNTKNYAKKIKKVEVDVLMGENSTHTYYMGEEKIKSDLDNYMDIFGDHVSENIFELFPKKNDAKIADAILELFRKREDITVFNKKALYIYIREIIDVKTPKITKIADKLHDIFKQKYIFYLENGYAKF